MFFYFPYPITEVQAYETAKFLLGVAQGVLIGVFGLIFIDISIILKFAGIAIGFIVVYLSYITAMRYLLVHTNNQ